MKKLLAMCLSLAMLLTATAFAIPAYADDEEATIEIWIAQADWADAWDEMKEKFEEEHPNIIIEDAGIQDDAGTFLSTRLAADNLPDVIQANMTDTLIKLVEGGKIVDAGKYEAAANIPDAYKENYTINGTLAGFSQGAAFTAMYYNMQILNEAGWEDIPKNWDEFIQCCKDIQEKTDAAPLVLAGAKLTCVFMPLELLVANYVVGDDYAADQYETDFKEGKFDWTAYPILAEKLEELNPFFMEGSSSLQEEDTFTAMADGDAAMCLAGNWNATSVCEAIEECTGDPEMAKASLPPFAAADAEATATSISPEDAFCVTAKDRTEAEQAAVDTFFEWVFLPENFAMIQNARGTVPVLTTMTDEYIVLPEAIKPVVSEFAVSPFVKMEFNMCSAEFKDIAISALGDCMSGNSTYEEALGKLWSIEQESPMVK